MQKILVLCFIFCTSLGFANEVETEQQKLGFMAKQVQVQKDFKVRLEKLEAIETPGNLREHYNQVSRLWEDIAIDLKQTIRRPYEGLSEALEDEESEATSLIKLWRQHVAYRFGLLKRAGRMRAKYLKILNNRDESLFKVDNKAFSRMATEVTLIPYKLRALFYEKLYWFLETLNQGVVGIFYLILEILIFLALLFIPFLFYKLAHRMDDAIEAQKKKSFYHSFRSAWHRRITFLLSVVSVYIPWIFSIIALMVVESLLALSEFSEVTYILPYFFYYIYYKIFRVTLEIWLQEFATKVNLTNASGMNQKVKNTSKILGLFLLIIYSLKTAFHSILGESLIFLTIQPFFGLMIFGLLLFVSSRWSGEIASYLEGTQLIYLKKYSEFMKGYFIYVLSLPGIVLVIVHYFVENLVDWSSQFDFVKLIYARVLRVKFETSRSTVKDMDEVGQNYREAFSSRLSAFHQPAIFNSPFFREINQQLEEWVNDITTEQTAAVYGGKGCGKSYFLTHLSGMEHENLDILRVSVPPRIFTEKSFDTFFQEILESHKEKKTLALIDNAHNLFISTIGGFEIYKKFLQVTEENKHIFWLATYNEYSWQFLNNILGKNQYFRLEVRMPRWTDEQIKDLILNVHKDTGFTLEYDQIFKSSQKLQEGVESAENRYFYLLWERSGGNPGLAIDYWFKSLNQKNSTKLLVSLPRENQVHELSKLHQEAHFIYAALVKHENLNVSEAVRATNLPRPVVKQAIIRGVEEGFLTQDKGRYRISIKWMDDMKKFLRGKNLIYESF